MTSNSDWKDEVHNKLIAEFKTDAESIARILHYLEEEEKKYDDTPDIIPPVYRILKNSLSSDKVFKMYTERLIQDTKRAEHDDCFRSKMSALYAEMMDPQDNPMEDDYGQDFDFMRLADTSLAGKTSFMGLSNAWYYMLPVSTQDKLLELLPKLASAHRNVAGSLDEVANFVSKSGGEMVMVGLAAVYLTWDILHNIWRWYHDEISGVRCIKNIIDSFVAIGAGVAGGVAVGSAAGFFFGPIGALVGGIIGGVVSSAAASYLSDRCTQYLFGLPKSEALENAYRHLGVSMQASNNEINTAFRRMCLKHHPDKTGGDAQEFHFLQLNMATIKMARDEAYGPTRVPETTRNSHSNVRCITEK